MRFLSLLFLCVSFAIFAGAQFLGANGEPFHVEAVSGELFECTEVSIDFSANGPLCLCTYDFTFQNPLAHSVTATFSTKLPFGAGALLFERKGGAVRQQRKLWNRFLADLPAVGANSTVSLRLSYGYVTTRDKFGEREIRIPLRGVKQIGQFELKVQCQPLPGRRVQVGEAWLGLKKEVRKSVVNVKTPLIKSYYPLYDFVLRTVPEGEEPSCVLQAPPTNAFLAFRPDIPAQQHRMNKAAGWFVAVDTSASRTVTGRDQLRLIRGILSRLGRLEEGRPFRLYAFDLHVKEIARWRGGKDDIYQILLPFLTRPTMGATDLSAMLESLLAIALKVRRAHRFIVFTDGSTTMGQKPDEALLQFSSVWPNQHRLDVVVLGEFEVDGVTTKLANLCGGRVIRLHQLATARTRLDDVVEKLRQPVGAQVRIVKSEEEGSLSPGDLLQSQFFDVVPKDELFSVGVASLVGENPGKLFYSINGREQKSMEITVAQSAPVSMTNMRQAPVTVALQGASRRRNPASFAQFALKAAKIELEKQVKKYMNLDARLRSDKSLVAAFGDVRKSVALLRKDESELTVEKLWTSLNLLKAILAPRLQAMQRVREKLQRGRQPTTLQLAEQLRAVLKENHRDRITREALCKALLDGGLWEELSREALVWMRQEPAQAVAYEYFGSASYRLGRKEEALRAASSLAEIAWGGHDAVNEKLVEQAALLSLQWEGFALAKKLFSFSRW